MQLCKMRRKKNPSALATGDKNIPTAVARGENGNSLFYGGDRKKSSRVKKIVDIQNTNTYTLCVCRQYIQGSSLTA